MKRTAIKQQNSLTLTLPKKWVELHGVGPHSELTVTEAEDGSLIVRAGSSSEKRHTNVRLESHTPSRLRTLIAGLYRRGFDSIRLESKQQFSLPQIEKIVQTMTGLHIVNLEEHVIELECTASVPSDLRVYVSKMFTLAHYVSKEQMQLGVEEKGLFRKQALELRDYLSRCIYRESFGGQKQTEYQLLVFFLEKYISCALKAKPAKAFGEFAPRIEKLRAALTNEDVIGAQAVNEALSTILRHKLGPQELLAADHLFSISSRVLSIVA